MNHKFINILTVMTIVAVGIGMGPHMIHVDAHAEEVEKVIDVDGYEDASDGDNYSEIMGQASTGDSSDDSDPHENGTDDPAQQKAETGPDAELSQETGAKSAEESKAEPSAEAGSEPSDEADPESSRETDMEAPEEEEDGIDTEREIEEFKTAYAAELAEMESYLAGNDCGHANIIMSQIIASHTADLKDGTEEQDAAKAFAEEVFIQMFGETYPNVILLIKNPESILGTVPAPVYNDLD